MHSPEITKVDDSPLDSFFPKGFYDHRFSKSPERLVFKTPISEIENILLLKFPTTVDAAKITLTPENPDTFIGREYLSGTKGCISYISGVGKWNYIYTIPEIGERLVEQYDSKNGFGSYDKMKAKHDLFVLGFLTKKMISSEDLRKVGKEVQDDATLPEDQLSKDTDEINSNFRDQIKRIDSILTVIDLSKKENSKKK